MSTRQIAFATLLATFAVTACTEPAIPPVAFQVSGNIEAELNRFEQQLAFSIAERGPGYSVTVMRNGRDTVLVGTEILDDFRRLRAGTFDESGAGFTSPGSSAEYSLEGGGGYDISRSAVTASATSSNAGVVGTTHVSLIPYGDGSRPPTPLWVSARAEAELKCEIYGTSAVFYTSPPVQRDNTTDVAAPVNIYVVPCPDGALYSLIGRSHHESLVASFQPPLIADRSYPKLTATTNGPNAFAITGPTQLAFRQQGQVTASNCVGLPTFSTQSTHLIVVDEDGFVTAKDVAGTATVYVNCGASYKTWSIKIISDDQCEFTTAPVSGGFGSLSVCSDDGTGESSGGEPPETTEYCYWARDFHAEYDPETGELVVFYWTSGWYMACYDYALAPNSGMGPTRRDITVSLLATGRLRNNRASAMIRDPRTGKIIVAIDTTRAGVADLDAALDLVKALSAKPTRPGDDRNTFGTVLGPVSPRKPVQPSSRDYHDRLSHAPVKDVYYFGRGRVLELIVQR